MKPLRIGIANGLGLAMVLLIAFAPQTVRAASVASDDAGTGNAGGVYTSFGNPPNPVNGGSGFGNWAISYTGTGGSFLDGGSQTINNGGKTWGLFSGSSGTSVAQRPFTGTLSVGQVFQVDLQFTGISSGNKCGFTLHQSDGTTSRLSFYFQGGDSNCSLDDSAGSHISIGAGGFPSGGFRVLFKLITANTYEITVLSGINGSTVYASTTRTLQGTSNAGIAYVTLFNNNAGSGQNAFFNRLRVSYANPTISAQPSSTTAACSGSTTPAMTVTASSLDGSTLAYAWRKRANGWGKTWTLTTSGNSGAYIGVPNGASGQNTPKIGSGNYFAVWSVNGSENAIRSLPATMDLTQTFSIDMQCGNQPNGGSKVGFGLTDASGNAYFEFQIFNGQADYTIHDSANGSTDTGIVKDNAGVHVDVTITGGTASAPTSYRARIIKLSNGATSVITGNLVTGGGQSGGISKLYMWNVNTGNSADVFFNNIMVGGADDSGNNYTSATWITGSDKGQKPLADGTTGNSPAQYAGSATASFTITQATTSDTTNYDCAVMSGQGYTTISSASALTVNASPTITTSATLPSGTANTAYSTTLAASGGTSPYTWTQTGGTLPTGITLSTAGVLSGTTTAPGTYTFTIQAADNSSTHCTASLQFTLIIGCGVTITISPTSLTPTVGSSYSQQLTASGGSGGYVFTILTGTLPAGLSMNSSGLITGTPTSHSSASFTVTATDSQGCPGSQAYTVTPSCPTITVSGSPPAGTVATAYSSTTFTASGANGSYTFTVQSGSLPTGLTLSTGGVLSGTPTAAGTYVFTVRATDSSGCTGDSTSKSVTISCPTITLSPASPLTGGTVGTAYSQTITASGVPGSFTFAKTSGTLPTGLTLSSAGVLSGTPTAAGTYNFDVTATSVTYGTCSGVKSYSVTMTCPTITVSLLSVNNSTLPFGVSNLLYSVTNNIFTASGSPATPYTFSSTTLPAGLSLSSAGALSGTPTTTNTVSFTVTATDTNNCTGTANYAITNGWAVAITAQPTNITVCSGSTASFTVAATGTGPLSYAWRKNNVGWGTGNAWTFVTTACNGTHGYYVGDSTACGGITPGIGTAYGLYANSGDSAEVTRNFGALQIGQSVVIDYQNPRDMSASGAGTTPLFALRDSSGTARFEFYFNGGDTQYTINDATPLPSNSGITYTPNGLQIVFTLVSADTYNLQVYRKSGSGNYTYINRTLKGTAGNAISQMRFYYRNTGGGGTACQDFFFNVVSVGGYNDLAANYSTGGCGTTDWANNSNKGQGPLSDGGSISGANSATLQIAGVSAADSNTIYSVVVYNSYGALKSGIATLNVNTSPSITTATPLPNGTVGTSYSKTIVATGGLTPYTWSISGGALPAGLSIGSSSGVISGVPTTAGTSAFTVSVSDSSATHCAGTSNMTITVSCPTIIVAPLTLNNVSIGVAYSQTVSASGGTSPYTYSVSGGALPSGITLDNSSGVISGTYNGSAGSSTFTITATDANNCTGSRAYTVTESACAAIAVSGTFPNGVAGTSYGSQTVSASGGASPYTFSVSSGSLPTGLTLASASSTTATVSGTPTATGTFVFTIQATDNNGCTGTHDYTIVVNCPTITLSSLPGGTVGTAYSQTITASGGNTPYTFTVSSGSLPGGLTLSSAGLLSGTPNAAGTFNFTVQAADTYGCTGTRAYSVAIGCTGTALSPSSLPGGTAGVAYSQTITFTGGTSPYSFSFASGTLPTGLTVSSAGVVSGTPSAAGSYTFTVNGTDGANCTASQQYTVSICGPPAVSSQPANTNVCSGSSASFTVTASGTSPLHYVWRKRTTGWGTGNGWTFAPGGGGFFMSSSAGNGGGSSGNINSSNNKAWGMYNDGGAATEAFRPIPGGLAVGETFAIDMDNGYINNNGYAGFGLRNASDENVLEFYFIGGQPAYKINGLTEQNTGIGHTVNGLHIEVTLTSATAYSVAITPAGSGTQTFTGTLLNPAGGRAITKLRMFNINANANQGANYDLYFNNISVGCYDDDAGNYTDWVNNGDKGSSPIAGAADNATYSISTASAGDAGSYDVCVTNACGITTSDPATLSVTTVDAAGAITGSATVCAGQSGVTYSIGAVTGATSYDWTVPTGATITAGGSGPNNTQITVTFGSNSGSVGVTPKNGSCSGTAASTAVTVVSVDAAGAITGSTSVCPSQSGVTYSISAVTGATSYDWTVPTGATITAGGSGPNNTQITVTFGSNSGSIGVTPKNGSCSGTPSSTSVTVSSSPTVTASSDAPFFGGAYQIVQGQTLHLSASSVGGATGYNWSRDGGGTFASGQTVSDVPAVGTHTYTVTVPTSCGTAVGSTPSITVLASTDGLIPDNWKTTHGYLSSKPATDAGANGMTLLQNYLAGVDPTNTVGNSLKVANISVSPAGMVTVDWNSKQDGTTAQRLYDVYYHTGPFSNGVSWTRPLSNEAPQGASSGIEDDVSAANITQRFYRVTIAGHTNDVATPEIAGVHTLHLVEGANYISLSMLPGTNTLLSVLGTNQLPQGATENTATTVDIWDQNNQVPGATYWLATGNNGWIHHGNNAPSNGVLLDPNKGLAITIRAGHGNQTLRIVGFVPTANEIQVVQGTNGYTVASSTFPTPIALNATGGGDGSGLVASGFLGGTSISRSDNLLFFNPATQLFDVRIWFATGTGTDNKWHNADGTVTTRKLQPGEAFLIQRSTFGGHAGNITWTNTVPYTTVPQLQGP